MDNYGLSGGIAWAWDDALCPALLPTFEESLFFAELVHCRDLQAAVARAFNAWASNNRAISFTDVTATCRELHGNVTQSCSLVEVWVTAHVPVVTAGLEYVEAAIAFPLTRSASNFR